MISFTNWPSFLGGCLLLCWSTSLFSQSYTSYFTGQADTAVLPAGGLCLMGGATENDEAMRWFLQRANGGDVVVLRASGNDGYNTYFYYTLGVSINSVETIVCNHASAAFEPYVQQRLAAAEAVWIAGGDQWDYVQYWRNTPIDSLIDVGVQQKRLVLGGTSAGMAILGGAYFSAQNGSISSSDALANPYDPDLTVDTTPFLQNRFLEQVITDTHYDNPSREGRQITFMARLLQDYGFSDVKGIACDDYTAVCIDTSGVARVFGGAPTYDDNAYFLQTNCALTNPSPERCQVHTPLQWDRNGQAVVVYRIQGTPMGNNAFHLDDWRTANGGTWQHWSVDSTGTLSKTAASAPSCLVLAQPLVAHSNTGQLYPNPCGDVVRLEAESVEAISVINALGVVVLEQEIPTTAVFVLNMQGLPRGWYAVRWRSGGIWTTAQLLKG